MRLSNDAFAKRLGIGVRTVAGWHQKPTLRPQSAMQEILDTALEQASPAVQARFAALTTEAPAPAAAESTPDAEHRLGADPNISAALHWLDEHAHWSPGTARREVAARLTQLDQRQLHDRAARRGRVDQWRIADALHTYYPDRTTGHGQYVAALHGEEALTSVLTHPDWLDLACPLLPPADKITVTNTTPDNDLTLDANSAGRAAQRIAETLALNIRMLDGPLFRLTQVAPRAGEIAATTEVTRFVRYALTMDLLEGELVDALATNEPLEPGSLPLRDKYLPNIKSVLDLPERLCCGGTLALCAIARPADPLRGPADYVLLVQERSGHVVNAARRLAVIPKGFHEPLTDYRADAHIGATLRREMEEELFGRDDIDSTNGLPLRADPMHPSRQSEPMRWLMAEPGRLRMECTGFGLNLVSGNFEFAGLIVIDDEEFWQHYGGHIEANWEATSLRQYSSLDRSMLTELIGDGAWSNEGLFALLQGLRRLTQVGGNRVDAPEIEWEIR
ncbi:transcriptional regulator [Actinophytocola xinjiangensis]|uniref:Transcriptional regulator n=1 Tax=Actinophytocola xinjiangensis TaxID=485602 RepID=A0A7Z0WMS1_9PSEU|nr:transcriptional regulator [Actinophytocola xinjiangensis]OLF10479.1 transcriptional regulator [Actinophytocola xinjiangensis]